MKSPAFVLPSTLACLLALASSTRAEVMLDPSAVSVNVQTASGSINNVINQSGLSTPYTSGVTDYASYTASTAAGGRAAAIWLTYDYDLGNVDFTLNGGSDVTIDSFALWGIGAPNDNRNIENFTLIASDDPTFATYTSLGSFTALDSILSTSHAQDFSFTATTASYVELQITSSYTQGGDLLGFNEGAFAEVVPSVIPEPSSLVLMGIGGIAGLVIARMRRKRLAA